MEGAPRKRSWGASQRVGWRDIRTWLAVASTGPLVARCSGITSRNALTTRFENLPTVVTDKCGVTGQTSIRICPMGPAPSYVGWFRPQPCTDVAASPCWRLAEPDGPSQRPEGAAARCWAGIMATGFVTGPVCDAWPRSTVVSSVSSVKTGAYAAQLLVTNNHTKGTNAITSFISPEKTC